METARIREEDFYPTEFDIINQEGVSFEDSIKRILKSFAVRRLTQINSEPAYRSSKRISINEEISNFITSNVVITDNREDKVTLRELYASYEDWLRSRNLIVAVATKQVFRKEVEAKGINYGKANGNKNVFRYIQLIEHDTDEDWEL